MIVKRIWLLFILSLTLFAAAVSFDQTTTVGDDSLVLNGTGFRKATFLKIKVYHAALYSEKKSKSASKLLSCKAPSKIIMHFLRDVSADKLKETWPVSFKETNKNVKELNPSIKKFCALMKDVKEGERIILEMKADGVSVKVADQPVMMMGDKDFSVALLRVFLFNPDKELRNGLLGK